MFKVSIMYNSKCKYQKLEILSLIQIIVENSLPVSQVIKLHPKLP